MPYEDSLAPGLRASISSAAPVPRAGKPADTPRGRCAVNGIHEPGARLTIGDGTAPVAIRRPRHPRCWSPPHAGKSGEVVRRIGGCGSSPPPRRPGNAQRRRPLGRLKRVGAPPPARQDCRRPRRGVVVAVTRKTPPRTMGLTPITAPVSSAPGCPDPVLGLRQPPGVRISGSPSLAVERHIGLLGKTCGTCGLTEAGHALRRLP
jgi:hypothetical protein